MKSIDFEDIFGNNSHDYFDYIIQKFELRPVYNVYQNNDDEIIIDEQWISNDSDLVKANRIFKFDPLFLDLIQEDSKLFVLQKALELYLSVEDYENAAIVRDVINIH
jgi:hypothetical protein